MRNTINSLVKLAWIGEFRDFRYDLWITETLWKTLNDSSCNRVANRCWRYFAPVLEQLLNIFSATTTKYNRNILLLNFCKHVNRNTHTGAPASVRTDTHELMNDAITQFLLEKRKTITEKKLHCRNKERRVRDEVWNKWNRNKEIRKKDGRKKNSLMTQHSLESCIHVNKLHWLKLFALSEIRFQ